jgi:3-oxoacyl-[acyl-carrier-protein] synthase II
MENCNHNRRVVVTGLGVVSPVGLDVESSWDALINGKSGIDNIQSFDATNYQTKFAAEVKDFDAATYINRKQSRHMDRFTQFAVAASLQALNTSKLSINSQNAEDIGVIIGNSVCGLISVCEQHKILMEMGPDRVSPALAPTMTGDAASVQVSLLLGAKGVNYAPSSACASGSDAIGHAYDLIRQGQSKAVLAGGTETPVAPLVIAAFNAIRALSTRNENPKASCRPFDMQRDGFVMGEGSAMMVLEDAEFAQARGANILAELVAYGASSDAFHLVQPSPEGEGAVRAIRRALLSSGLSVEDIDYIHAHGTATLLNDRVEATAIKKVFGERAKQIPVSATKSMTGHMLGASGSMGALISVLALNKGILPPTMNLTDPDPECDLDFVANKARPAKIHTAMVNSFGFGGHNAVLIFHKNGHHFS